jgi:methionine synthase II (cobalamin-independent)
MRLSTDRILTTHAGSLPRPDDLAQMLFDVLEEKPIDAEVFRARVREAVADIVAREREVGIDEISDGELGKVGFSNYVLQRMSGFAGVVLRITGAGICGTDATLFRLGPDVVPAGPTGRLAGRARA